MVKYKIIENDPDNYKYEVLEQVTYQTQLINHHCVHYEGIYPQFSLQIDGKLTIFPGFKYDGPSGPAIDTFDSMDGSLVHDALYRAIKLRKLPFVYSIKFKSDYTFYKINAKSGIPKWRNFIWFITVLLCGWFSLL